MQIGSRVNLMMTVVNRNLLPAMMLLSVILIIESCGNKKSGPDPLMADLEQTDSTEIIYFRSPDSVRYFTFLPSTDQQFISDLVSNLKQDTVPEITCMKEGKIYLFKNGSIFNTVFFGYLDKDCRFLRYIKNGHLYHYELSEELEARLVGLKPSAKEPLASDQQ